MNTERRASVKALIKEAELATAPSDFVHQFYLDQSKLHEDNQSEDVDEFTEQRLLDKNDPFIDLTLAQYCFHPETLGALFNKSRMDKNVALELACISNTTVSRRRYTFVKLPEALFTQSREGEIGVWFKMIRNEEIDALFRNPTIDDGFLSDVLEGKQFWAEMTDEQKTTALMALCNNPRIVTHYDNEMMDGYAEYLHRRVPNAIWHLAEILPVQGEWAILLGSLLAKVVGGTHGMDMVAATKRWDVVDEKEKEEKKKQWLNPFESVRYALYKAGGQVRDPYGKDRAEVRKQLLANDDLAFRAAVYSQLQLTPDEITSAYEKDKLVAFQYTIDNLQIWKNPDSRKALHDICWDADGRYNNNYMDCANHYKWKEKELKTKYPEWFVEKEESSEPEEIDETKQALTVSVTKELLADRNANPALHYAELIHALIVDVGKALRALNWIFWGLVALFVFEVYKR